MFEFLVNAQASALKKVRVVLVRAENSANIGQAARAMKNFGVERLALVHCVFHRVPEAYTVGWKARGILDDAACFGSLEEALSRPGFTVGFTTRKGKRRGQPCLLMDAVPEILAALQEQEVSLVFGNEKNGLSNEELRKCQMMVTVPAAREYASLNLSHAVAIVLSLLFGHTSEARQVFRKPERFCTRPEEFEALMNDVLCVLELLEYRNTSGHDLLTRVHQGFRQYFLRSGLDRRELHLFQALLNRIQEELQVDRNGKVPKEANRKTDAGKE